MLNYINDKMNDKLYYLPTLEDKSIKERYSNYLKSFIQNLEFEYIGELQVKKLPVILTNKMNIILLMILILKKNNYETRMD